MDEKTLIQLDGLKQYFPLAKTGLGRKRRFLRAVDGVSLQIKQGETFGLVGESGCGKSTLGKSILQLYKRMGGEVWYYPETGERIALSKQSKKQMRALRKDLQIVFQDPYSSLNPRMTVGQIIGEGVTAHGLYKPHSKALQSYVLEVMQKCGLDEYALHRYPHEFSGGQRQRVCIARALAVKPKFVVCDECVSALDVSIQAQIINLLSHLKEKENLTYLFISHDLSVVRHIADTIAVMYLGKIVEIGKGERVFKNPLHPYTMALIRSVPTLAQNKNSKRIYLPPTTALQDNESVGCPFAKRCFMAKDVCFSKPVELWEGEKGHYASCHFVDMPKKQKEAQIDGERE
ncbi:MAG: ABC transporter ATP-binding protein [Clostridia bacterium]|nr:ABC transporter ATP-binding protein [Clostridia bacterium]